jgi:hypothetical protein
MAALFLVHLAAGCVDYGDGDGPEPPAVSAPVEGQEVASPVAVEISGESEATVRIQVVRDGEVLGEKIGHQDEAGEYSASISYLEPEPEAAMQVVVELANVYANSEPTAVDVTQKRPPDPPMLSSPAAGDEVKGTVDVRGSARPGAYLEIKILRNNDTIGFASENAAGDGSFSLPVEYATGNVQNDEGLVVAVTQADSVGTSAPAEVNVTHSLM